MKDSIRAKLFITMGSLIVFFLMFFWILNLFVLERYYNHVKKETILSSYESVKDIFKQNPEEINLEIEKIENENGLHIVIMDRQLNTIYDSRQKEMNGAVRGEHHSGGRDSRNNMPEYIIKTKLAEIEKGKPIIEVRKDSRLNTNFISLFSKLNDQGYIFMSTPVAIIKESVQISNDFFILTGLITIFIGGILIFLLSNRFTRPILELSEIAQRMAHLDFGKKYKVQSKDEFGQLGESINSLSEHLQKSIQELKEANDALKEDIEKKQAIDEMRKEFISSASHELKTPIALISGYAEGLKVNVNNDEENKNYYCDVIIDESSKMNKLVNNLLELSQLESGELPLDYSSFDIVQLIESVIKKNTIIFEDKGINVKFENEEKWEVLADYHKVEQVLNNFVSNAINHIGNENIIKIRIKGEKNVVKIFVYNSGKNIPHESLDKIWASFYKVDKARTRAYGGSGLGLSVVRAIMEAHGNNYGVENLKDGVEFWFEVNANQPG